jgi:hypothetical protein
MSKSIRELSELAASWWGETVCKPAFNNGDNSLDGAVTQLLAHLGTKQIDSDTKEKFIAELTNEIELKLASAKGNIIVSVDYGPDKILSDAATSVHMTKLNFPLKTTMWINMNSIIVSSGYRAPIKELYANKAYWRDKISSAEESIESYENGTYTCDWIEDEEERKKQVAEDIKFYRENLELCKKSMEKAED